MMNLNAALKKRLQVYAKDRYPEEACGLLGKSAGKLTFYPCRNMATDPHNHFVIHPEDYCRAADAADICAIVHSHPDQSARPTMADRVSCELHGLPWYIVGHDGQIEYLEPTGYLAPLLGREFCHGILDCWTACRDWYQRELSVSLRDFERRDLWWEQKDGPSLYAENYAGEGFCRVDTPQRGDILIMRILTPGRPCYHPNHAAIYLGEDPGFSSEEAPRLGGHGPFIYHHLYGRPARRDIYGHGWSSRTEMILRYGK